VLPIDLADDAQVRRIDVHVLGYLERRQLATLDVCAQQVLGDPRLRRRSATNASGEWSINTPDHHSGIKSEYLADNSWARARERLTKLEADNDVDTIRRMEARQVGFGWQCLDVGGGSIADWPGRHYLWSAYRRWSGSTPHSLGARNGLDGHWSLQQCWSFRGATRRELG
jgi:hypothetical protein